MSLYFLLLIAFLFPLFCYLLILGLINRRRSPLMIPGTWDFVGVLFGMSGFILAGSAYLLYRIADICRSFDLNPRFMWVFVTIYFAFILLVVVIALVQRRQQMRIYNIHPTVFERVLGHVLEKKGYQWSRAGNLVVIQTTTPEPALQYAAALSHGEAVPPEAVPQRRSPGLASLTMSLSRLGYCVALRWECYSEHAEQAIRQEIERSLEAEMEELVTEDNPLASLFVSFAILLFVAIITTTVLLVLFVLRNG
jgi:hypothetical protein